MLPVQSDPLLCIGMRGGQWSCTRIPRGRITQQPPPAWLLPVDHGCATLHSPRLLCQASQDDKYLRKKKVPDSTFIHRCTITRPKRGEWLHVNTLTSLWEAAGKSSSLLFQEIHETVITYRKSFMLYYTAMLQNIQMWCARSCWLFC